MSQIYSWSQIVIKDWIAALLPLQTTAEPAMTQKDRTGSTTSFVVCITLASLLVSPTLAAQTPTLDDRFCQKLVKHVPDADVAYQAGRNVHGKPVVPADLDGGTTITLPQEITIPLTVDLMAFLKLDASALPASAMKRNDLQLGTLTLRGDQVFYNGQPLTNAQQDNMAVLCLKPNKIP